MSGKKGRSGRRPGSISYPKNPTALAGHHLKVLIEMWLAGVPIRIGDRYLVPESERRHTVPPERRHTVPPKIMRVLAEVAIGHMLNVTRGLTRLSPGLTRLDVDEVRRRRAASRTPLNEREFERETAYQEFVDKVLAWARRRAPGSTLRRVVRSTPLDEREATYRSCNEDAANAWKGKQP